MDPSWTINSCWISLRMQACCRGNMLPTFRQRPQEGMTAIEFGSVASAPPTTYAQLRMACGLHYVVRRMAQDLPTEIIDVACRISGRWEHGDHATARPFRRRIRQGHKGSGDALQNSIATCREFVGGDICRCGR